MSQNANSVEMSFSPTYRTAQIALMELTEDLLKQLMSEGQFVIKGAESEEAVLCTKTASYLLKEAPSSNNLLLLESNPLKTGAEKGVVVKTLQAHYQLNRTTINMELLKSLLRARPLDITSLDTHDSGMDVDGDLAPLHTLEDLERRIQCSKEELKAALKKISAFEFEGHMRVLNLDSEYAIARHLALTVNAQGFDLTSIDKSALTSKAKSSRFSDQLIEFAVGEYLEVPALAAESDTTRYVFNVPRYNAIAARTILSKKPQWNLNDFLESWKALLPDNFAVDLASLDGIAYTEEYGKDIKLHYLLASELSHNIKTRLAELFKCKPKWTFAHIKPYLQDLLTPEMNEEQLLVAHTRSSNGPNGTRLYSTR